MSLTSVESDLERAQINLWKQNFGYQLEPDLTFWGCRSLQLPWMNNLSLCVGANACQLRRDLKVPKLHKKAISCYFTSEYYWRPAMLNPGHTIATLSGLPLLWLSMWRLTFNKLPNLSLLFNWCFKHMNVFITHLHQFSTIATSQVQLWFLLSLYHIVCWTYVFSSCWHGFPHGSPVYSFRLAKMPVGVKECGSVCGHGSSSDRMALCPVGISATCSVFVV